jgi:ankyrin repeat protein
MKHLLLTTIAAVVLVGCGPSVDIWTAARTGNIEVAKQAIADGADVNGGLEAGDLGDTPLHTAVDKGHKEIVELLIAEGADVDTKNVLEETILHIAARRGHKEIVELLIANGMDVNAENEFGSTPLHHAFNKEIAELLIAGGADVNANKRSGTTPLDSAENLEDWYTPEDIVALKELADLIRKHGGKTGAELKTEGK